MGNVAVNIDLIVNLKIALNAAGIRGGRIFDSDGKKDCHRSSCWFKNYFRKVNKKSFLPRLTHVFLFVYLKWSSNCVGLRVNETKRRSEGFAF